MLVEWTLMKEQYTSTKSIKSIAKEHNIPYVKLLRLNKQINKRIPEDQLKYIQEQIDKHTVFIKEEEKKEEEEKKVMDTKIDTIVKLEPYINDIIKRIQYLEQKEDREPPRDVLFIIVLMLMLFLNFIKVFGVRYI